MYLINVYLPTVKGGQQDADRDCICQFLSAAGAQLWLEEALLLVQSDLNATTQGCRQGYALITDTSTEEGLIRTVLAEADQHLEQLHTNLCLLEAVPPEVCSWHDASGELSAALDHTWFSPELGEVLQLNYHWFAECPMDHAMMTTQLPQQAWAPQLEITALDQKEDSWSQEDLPIDFSKWAEKEAAWRADLELQIQVNHCHLQSIKDPFD